jgi:hypothetical protein
MKKKSIYLKCRDKYKDNISCMRVITYRHWYKGGHVINWTDRKSTEALASLMVLVQSVIRRLPNSVPSGEDFITGHVGVSGV